MKQSLQLNLGQRQNMTMTPQLQQAIRLLQLSSTELSVEIQQALDSNIMLEVADGEQGEPEQQEVQEQSSDELDLESPFEIGGGDPEDAEGSVPAVAGDIPEEMPVDSDWSEIYDSSPGPGAANASGTEAYGEAQVFPVTPESLKDHLCWQVNHLHLVDADLAIALAIIDAVNEDGYFMSSVEEVQSLFARSGANETSISDIERILNVIQGLDPVGVAARNVKECLLLQLDALPKNHKWLSAAHTCCSKYMDLMESRDDRRLAKKLGVQEQELPSIFSLIRSMNPRPGSKYSSQRTEYIIPDVYVLKRKGRWGVELNLDVLPKIRVNTYYKDLIRRSDNSDENVVMKTHLQEARWFMKSLQRRGETLLRVSRDIIERQSDFLEFGEEAMKPLVLHDVASKLDLDESTISRVTTRKYMHTPRGIFELKYFFSSQVSGEESSTAIKAKIKKLIAAENIKKPLSDQKIVDLLTENGVAVARRTVSKYREAMSIPPSNERKRLV
jgi:RNA polymerase sigma-54 factor